MQSFHPMAVHLPIALVILWPLADGVGLITGRKDISVVGVAMLLLAIAAALLATVTGQAAYDVAIANGVAPAVLDQHASKADLVPWLLLVLAVLRVGGVRKLGRPAQIGAIAGGIALAIFVIVVGNSGGTLVFEHGVGVAK